MTTHLLLEAAVRSLLMGAIILLALRLLRIEQVRARRTAWLLALIGALGMPVLVAAQIGPRLLPETAFAGFSATELQSAAPSAPAEIHHQLWSEPAGPPEQNPAGTGHHQQALPANAAILLAVIGYCAAAAVLGLRLCTGLGFALRLRNGAERVVFPFDAGLDVRTSARVATPVTVGSTVLLPLNYTLWDLSTLRVVLSHERAHVRQKDFYVHALAGLHCALFWFNPFSWWLQRQLSDLGEALSDCAAVEQAESRTAYAETLLAFASAGAGRGRWPMSGVAMASASNLTPRIERLLNDRGFERSFAPQRRLRFVAAGVAALAMLASTSMVRVQAASAAAPSPPAPPSSKHHYTYLEDNDGEHAQDEEILAIQSDHSKLMFESGDELPRQPGDYIYFQHDGKPYLIQDPKIIAKAQELLQPMQALHEQQRDLGRQQSILGAQQRMLSHQEGLKLIESPDFKREMAEMQKTLKEVDLPRLTTQIDVKAIDEKALAEVQAHLGEIQARVARLQAEFGRHGAIISSDMAEKMGKLGEQQGKLGEQQRKLIDGVKRQLKPMIEQAIREGRAKPSSAD